MTGAPALRPSAETKGETAFRYGISVGAFVLTMVVAAILRHFSISIDLSLLVIAALICSAWYGGRGPGITAAILFELAYMLLSKPRPEHWAAMLLVEFNRTALFLALLVTAQRKAMRRLKEQGAWLRVTLSSIADGVIAAGLKRRSNFHKPDCGGHDRVRCGSGRGQAS